MDTLSAHARRAAEHHQYHDQMGTYEAPMYEYATSGPNEQEVMCYIYNYIYIYIYMYIYIYIYIMATYLYMHFNIYICTSKCNAAPMCT